MAEVSEVSPQQETTGVEVLDMAGDSQEGEEAAQAEEAEAVDAADAQEEVVDELSPLLDAVPEPDAGQPTAEVVQLPTAQH